MRFDNVPCAIYFTMAGVVAYQLYESTRILGAGRVRSLLTAMTCGAAWPVVVVATVHSAALDIKLKR